MSIFESFWILTGLLVILLILITDPKSASRGFGGNEITMLFSSVSDVQKFIRHATWSLIAIFMLLTLNINL